MKLGRKLGLAFAGMILIYGLMLGALAYQFSRDYICSDLLDRSASAVSNLKDYFLKIRVSDLSRAVVVWSEDSRLGSGAGAGRPLQAEWRNFLSMNPNVSAVYYGESSGGFTAAPEEMDLPKDYDPRLRAWYREAAAAPKQAVWSTAYVDAGASGELVMTVSKAVERQGRVVGVLGMDIRLADFSGYVNGISAGGDGAVIILDRDGQVLAHPDSTRLAHKLQGAAWTASVMAAASGDGFYTEDGRQFAYAFVTLPDAGWKVVSIRRVDLGALYGSLKRMTVGTAVMMALVMVLGGLLAGRCILKPLRSLSRTIRTVSEGDLTVRCGLTDSTELGAISTAFNGMLDRIAAMNGERDRHLEALTVQNREISEQKQEIHSLYEMTDAIHQELEESFQKMRAGYLATVRALANAVDANDHYTRGHCDRVSAIALRLGAEAGLLETELKDLEFAGILHDIGKLGIHDGIINKPGRLTEEELAKMRRHPEIGGEILSGVEFLEVSRRILMQHHERFDGGGYPRGLAGEEIHLSARILAIADAFDAMTSQRPYRASPMSVPQALEELRKGRGAQFDPTLVDRFVDIMDREGQRLLPQQGAGASSQPSADLEIITHGEVTA